jgi:nucleotide-binding universal stress UspA family protein
MMRKIVVGLDGSARSERSLPWVDRLFRDSEKILVKAVRPSQTFGGYVHEEGHRRAREAAQAYLQSISMLMPQSNACVYEGSAAHALLTVADKTRADAIVITTHGGSDPTGTTMGGTAEQVLYGSHRPLLIVPSGGEPPAPVARLRKILVPLDGSLVSEMILPLAHELAESQHVGVLLAHVLTGLEEIKFQYQDMAGHFDWLKKRRLGTQVVVRKGKLPESIVTIAQEHEADLVVMSAHGHGGLPRMLFGSIAAKLIRMARTPVLVAKYETLKKLARKPDVPTSVVA